MIDVLLNTTRSRIGGLSKSKRRFFIYPDARSIASSADQHSNESEEASAFVTAKLDSADIDRLTNKLDRLALTLVDSGATRHSARSCLIDALSCECFLAAEDLVRQHFDRPFDHLRRKALTGIDFYVPGATAFLFDGDTSRRQWAMSMWSGCKPMSKEDDFNFAIRGPLLKVLQETASFTVNDSSQLERFWVGIRTVMEHLESDIITHSLRALEAPDVFKLALEQLHYDTKGFKYILQALSVMLETAPKDYWESMGTISPTTVIENIFNSHYTTTLEETWSGQEPNDAEKAELFGWLSPFVNSLQTVHQSQACRAIAAQLMKKLQAASLPSEAKIECWKKGLGVIKLTLLNCNKEKPFFGPTGRIVAAESLEVVTEYIDRILSVPMLSDQDQMYKSCATLSLNIVELGLTLECKSLRTDQEMLRTRLDIDPGACAYGPAVWDKLVQQLVHRNVELAGTALSGINGLMGLEKFITVKDETNRSYKSEYNVKLGHLTHLACQMLEQINDFDQADLDLLFRKPNTATALVASLFSADASTYEAGVNLMKTISSQIARQEAVRHVIVTFFDVTLDAMSRAIRRIANDKVYAPCPRMLQTCKDVLGILCNTQTGLFRERTLQNLSEAKAVENFWQYQWDVLKVIYEMVETWSKAHLVDKEVMKDFCRDTMDFSGQLLDQFSIFASAINSSHSIKQEDASSEGGITDIAKRLLDPPARNMQVFVKWLRLREQYLVDNSVKLTTQILGRLTENAVVLSKESSDFVELVIRGGPQGRTNVKPQGKAELAEALEANLGRPILPIEHDSEQSPTPEYQSKKPQPAKRAKDAKIDFEAWTSKSKLPRKVIEVADDDFEDSGITDAEIVNASRSVEISKKLARRPQVGLQKAAGSWTSVTKLQDPKAESLELAKQASFRDKRKKEMEAKKKRDAEQAAILRKKAPASGSSLGIQGKDHAPKASGVMISSGSESESEDDADRDLFGSLTKAPKISDAVRDIQADRMKQLRVKGPIKKTRQIRSAKDMRARLAPDLTSLHKEILAWDYFSNGDFPPGSGRNDYSLVTNRFRDPFHYQETFKPLLALEGWQGFLKSKEEGSAKVFEVKVANRLTVDSFVEVATMMTMQEGKDLGISEADIVLMSKGDSPATEAQQPHCLGRVFKISRKKATMDITYRVNVGNPLLASMNPKATLYAVKILSLTPLEREYGALLGLKYFDLCDEIIKARPSPILQYSEQQLSSLVSKYKINYAQAKAVRCAIDNDAFTLIQGPPGSGKTKTIVAIVGALLTGQFQEQGTAIARPSTNGSKELNAPRSNAVKKLLVCAPSNAAVDELVMRFKEGIRTLDGVSHRPSVIRLGRSDAINANVLDVTLEELVNAKLNTSSEKKNNTSEDIHQMMMAHKSACDEFNELRGKLDALKGSGKTTTPELERGFELLKRKKQQLSNKIDAARDSGNTVARDLEINRRKVQQDILDSAHIICATLSGSGHEMFQSLNIEFETVVIDEAAQSIELSALIPLKYGCSKCVLVGDPKQLPPTVLSREAARFQYEQSLFVRMQINHPEDVHLLDTQYRMHPEISAFPSREFYDGRLLDGAGMAESTIKPWHQCEILGPYRFFDVQGTQQSAPRGHSLINIAEIEMALKLFARLTTDCKGYDFAGKVGIITPYKSQLRELRSRFAQRYGEAVFATIEFNTTDAFQGRESEIIIFSCVRASVGRGIGFVSDIRRMNVGITRAKSSLWVLGNSQSLMQGEFWAKLILDAKTRGRYSGPEASGLLQKPLVRLDPKAAMKAKKDPVPASAVITREVEMVDAPTLNGASPILNGKPKRDIVSGGSNGMDTTRTCATCGSTAHYSHLCDNLAAQASARGGCYRCGELGHDQERCPVERCIECGRFGHTQQICTSRIVLSKSEKDKIKISEANHKRRLDRLPEKSRKRQIGDHDNSVPVVFSTLDTPPLPVSGKKSNQTVHDTVKKRPREPSPPPYAPKGPKEMVRGPSQSLPLRSPTSMANPTLDTILRERGGELDPEPQSPVGAGSRKVPVPNVKPPPVKKKKDADMFIRPNKKRK